MRLHRAILGGAFAVTFLLVACTSGATHPPTPSPTMNGVSMGIGGSGQIGDDPFIHGQQVSLTEAEVALRTLPRPNDPLASDATVSKVWMDTIGSQPQVEIVYDSGLQLQLTQAPDRLLSRDGQRKLFAQEANQDAAQTNGAATVVSINGAPALLVPENSAVFANGQSQGAGGDLTFVVAGFVLDLFGQFTNQELTRAASTIPASAPG